MLKMGLVTAQGEIPFAASDFPWMVSAEFVVEVRSWWGPSLKRFYEEVELQQVSILGSRAGVSPSPER
jgi:hypothetical protein